MKTRKSVPIPLPHVTPSLSFHITNVLPESGSPFEATTIPHFVLAATSGNFPGNKKTSLPLFPKEEMKNISEKYAAWAPEPWRSLPGPAGPFGATTMESPAPMIRIMHVVSGLDEIFEDAMKHVMSGKKGVDIKMLGRSFKIMKSKVCVKTLSYVICLCFIDGVLDMVGNATDI